MSLAEARWATRIEGTGALAPYWLGLFIVVGYLLMRGVFDLIFLVIWGFPVGVYPLWQGVWWPELVNATLLGYVPAALLIARRGIDRDLTQLRPWLPHSDATLADLRAIATGPAGLVGRALILSGLVVTILLVFIDPSLTPGTERSLTNPAFLWSLFRIPLMVWMISILIACDLNATRSYLHVGRLIEVDLLDVQSLSPFARRGLRSALTWIVFSIIFSLFWVGDTSEFNLALFIFMLTMAIGAYIAPLAGVHNNIVSVKRSALARSRDEIRIEREIFANKNIDATPESPRLANLIAYYQLIEATREWPIDAANLLRFFMYLLIGLGSWLGGAFVELLLDRTLSG